MSFLAFQVTLLDTTCIIKAIKNPQNTQTTCLGVFSFEMIANFAFLYYIIIMKVNIVCVGKIKEKFFTDAISEYQKRLSRFCDFKIIEVDEASNEKNLEKKSLLEGKLLLSKCKGVIVSLDGNGKLVSSEGLADLVKQEADSSVSEITFVIGGSNGLSKEVLDASKFVISFGKITFPHQLFRVVLSEQIYRAFTILAGLPYHK